MKKLLDKQFWTVTSILSSIILAIFVTLSVVLIQEGNYHEPAYEEMEDFSDYDNVADMYSDYQNCDTDKYELRFKPFQMTLIGLENLKTFDDTRVITKGVANAQGIEQSISGTTLRVGNSYFNESISASFLVKAVWRIYEDDTSVKTYNGSYIDAEHGDFNVTPTEYTPEDFKEVWGRSYKEATPYIISSKTLLSESLSRNEDNDYICTLSLNPELSVINYVKQMKKISKLPKMPTFSNVNLTITLNKDLVIKTVDIDESYVVEMLGVHETHATMRDTYSYNTGIKIPQIGEDAIYD